jgi:N-acetylmuramic acid 6-phosphate etherase
MAGILELLNLTPSPQSVDYVDNKTQFHLFNLLTEQRHPRTWNLSFALESGMETGLRMLLSVDEDVAERVARLAADPSLLEQAVEAVVDAVLSRRRIYVYGCGATGRLAKQMESNFWRPFWRRVRGLPVWARLAEHLPDRIEDHLVGEMTGADRALVSSLEGFEDLQLIGKLQLEDHGISRGDVVICVTEGGETSSVIGTVLAALAQYGELDPSSAAEALRRLYFVCNNPPEVLRPFARSVSVLDNPAITHINLTTGPQAITGSTRLQATTSETFVVGVILEEAIGRILRRFLSRPELAQLGYSGEPGVVGRLGSFQTIKASVDKAVPEIAQFSALERDTYRKGRFSTYFAKTGLVTVFIDNTERSPTFRLYPLDKVEDPERRCWVQVWTEARDLHDAWEEFLGRPFRGLSPELYREPFEHLVDDPYLRDAALRSLANAGNDQELSYDFSFSAANVQRRGLAAGDLAAAVLVDSEIDELQREGSSFRRFVDLARSTGNGLALLLVSDTSREVIVAETRRRLLPGEVLVHLALPDEDDPLTLRRQIALKMLLNAHSTAIMAALGRVIGNTMTSVSPSNLKLIGRATYLVLSHVNDTIRQPEWIALHGEFEPLTFREVNAVLVDAMEYVRDHAIGQTAEVAMSIVRILEALERRGPVEWEETRRILEAEGLASCLARRNPALARQGG